ncbi:MAG: Ig-like domain-containing protein [Verrucomicrobiota bacterium]
MSLFRSHLNASLFFSAFLLLSSTSQAAVTDFPVLNPDHPTFGLLYSNVNIGNTTIPSSTWPHANETLNAAYAYLHPQSPYRFNTLYLDRLKILLDARFDEYLSGDGLGDMSGCFQASYAYMLLKHHSPSDLTAAEISKWEEALIAFTDHQLSSRPELYDDYIVADSWHNGDIRMAMAVFFTGVVTSNTLYQNKGADAIDLYLTQCVVGDGAIHKSGFQNESASYRNWNIYFMLWWWTITGSPEMKAALDKTIPWVPLSVEPSGFPEQSTSVAVKHMYNGGRGQQAALITAYLYGDRYNYFFGQDVENELHDEWSILFAVYYNGGQIVPETPPSEFILYDRAILGPRIRTPEWLAVATSRNPQIPAPDHPDKGYEGKQTGRNTFVGAAALGPWSNNTSLKAALDGVAVEFKNKTGVTTDWARSNRDGGKYRFLAQDEQTYAIVRKNFGTLSTSYRISERVTGGSTPSWGPGTDWLGEQLWLLTKERVVGLVQIHNDAADQVYGLDTRIVLVGGRKPILGSYLDVVEVATDDFEFGELQVRVPQTTFTGPRSVQRTTVYGSNTDDDYTALLRLHDAADQNDDTLISYPAGTRRWAVVECTRKDTGYAVSAINVLPENSNVAVLQVIEGDRRFRLVQNLTGSNRSYTGNFWGAADGDASLHKSWTEVVEDVTPAPGSAVAMNVQLPAFGHAVVVSSDNPLDHSNEVDFYEDVFTEGNSIAALDQEVSVPQETQVGIRLESLGGTEVPSYAIKTPPANGTLIGTPPIVAYTPDLGFIGTDTFTFEVTNGEGDGDEGTVTLLVSDQDVVDVWYPSGQDVDRTFTNMTDKGFTLLFHDQSDNRGDVAAVTDFETPITLDEYGQRTMFLSFRISDITTSAGNENLLRIGFRNDDSGKTFDATLHYVFGYGSPGNFHDVRFAGNSDTAHFFSGGSTQDQGDLPDANALFTGNSSEIELQLTYLRNNGNGTHDYRATVFWDGQKHSSSTITRNTDTWDSAYVQANNPIFQVAGDGFTISDTVVGTRSESYFDLSYQYWAEEENLQATDLTTDFDEDKASDFMEFALGGVPTLPGHRSVIDLSVAASNGQTTFSFPRLKYYDALQTHYVVKTSHDLVDWEAVSVVPTVEPLNEKFDLVTITLPMLNESRAFFKLEIVPPN